jgi:threonine/homoserine/homoserine lactone efflux protein
MDLKEDLPVIESLVLGITLGLFAGLIPGAYSTVVATTALERGMKPGLKVALIPLATEIPVMLAAVFVLTRLPEGAFRWIGMGGGALLLFMGWKVFRDAGERQSITDGKQVHGGHFLRVVIFGLVSPGPWAFWFFVGAPLLLSRWRVGAGQGITFLSAFMVTFIGVMLALAWAVASGRHRLSLTWYRRILRGAGGLLVLVGGILIWQSWVGNFTQLVSAPPSIEERIEES